MTASREQRVITAQRRVKAWQLKIAGATLDEIATALNYASPAAVSKDLTRSMQALQAAEKGAKEALTLELARIDRVQRGSWTAGVAGDPKAAMVVLACIDRRVKLLGLDAPVKVESTVHDAASERERLAVQELINEARAQAANADTTPAEDAIDG